MSSNDLSLGSDAAAIQACTQLIYDYGYAADHDDLDLFLSVFATDAEVERSNGTLMTGHEQLRSFFVGRPPNRAPRCHAAVNVRVRLLSEVRAAGTSNTLVYPLTPDGEESSGLSVMSIIEYRDEFSHVDGLWKISRRRGVYLFNRGA